ncbi:MAG: ATP-binding protein [Pseudomonadota bacterium]
MNRLIQAVEQVDAIFIIDAAGTTALTTRVFPPPKLDESDRDYYRAHAEGDVDVYVGQAHIGKVSHLPIFNLSVRRARADGSFDGVIALAAYIDYFERFYAEAGSRDDRYAIALIRADGAPLVRYPAPASASPAARAAEFADVIPGSEEGTVWTVGAADGVRRLSAHRKLAGFPVYVTYGIDERAIMAAWRRDLLAGGGTCAAVAAGLFMTAWIGLQRARAAVQADRRWQQTSADLVQEIDRRERAEATVAQTQKLEALGRLTGGIAHDFNNLLTIISGNVEMADARVDSPAVHRLLTGIQQAAERGETLTRQMLAFAKPKGLRPETVDLNAVIEAGRFLITRAVGETVQVDIEPASAPCPVRIDVPQLQAALLNLAVNARDAMPCGGKLTIRLRRVALDAPDVARPAALKPGSYARITVSDTGTGMGPEVLARVYEPFFSTKAIDKGTGLGLSQVYGLVQQAEGFITIASVPGSGTTVTILLPHSPDALAGTRGALPGQPMPSGSGVALVVEDQSEVRTVVADMLHDLGYRTIAAGDGVQALWQLREGEKIDLLLADIVLPGGMSGIELARHAKLVHPDLKVLLTSGYDGDIVAPPADQGLAVLRKPFARGALAWALHTLGTTPRSRAG